jgi:hypothetical protein
MRLRLGNDTMMNIFAPSGAGLYLIAPKGAEHRMSDHFRRKRLATQGSSEHAKPKSPITFNNPAASRQSSGLA